MMYVCEMKNLLCWNFWKHLLSCQANEIQPWTFQFFQSGRYVQQRSQYPGAENNDFFKLLYCKSSTRRLRSLTNRFCPSVLLTPLPRDQSSDCCWLSQDKLWKDQHTLWLQVLLQVCKIVMDPFSNTNLLHISLLKKIQEAFRYLSFIVFTWLQMMMCWRKRYV